MTDPKHMLELFKQLKTPFDPVASDGPDASRLTLASIRKSFSMGREPSISSISDMEEAAEKDKDKVPPPRRLATGRCYINLAFLWLLGGGRSHTLKGL